MRLRYKGRKYKVNLTPLLLLFLVLVALVVFGVSSCTKGGGGDAESSSGDASANSTGSSIPEEGAEPAAAPSDGGILVGGEPSSLPTSDSGSSLSAEGVSSDTSSAMEVPTDLPEGSLPDWNLILLGPAENQKIDQDLDIEKIKFDTQYVDARAAPAYQRMADAAKEEGITLYLRSGYRSIATQKTNYEANVQRELAKGNNEAEAIRLTNLYYTIPGHSEHHSGLAFDIITPEYHNDVYDLNESFADTSAYQWLLKNCATYGFILRYPKEKVDITQINFEPWHYRYVGVEHANYIMSHGLCLEEYTDLLKAAGR